MDVIVKSCQTKVSNTRAEVTGTDLVQEYCRTSSLQKVVDMPSTTNKKLKLTQKLSAVDKSGGTIKRLDMDDFSFRVSYQTEQDFNIQSPLARSTTSKWMESKKLLRFMNRTRFYHEEYPILADLSIVKTAKKTSKIPTPQYTIQEAGVFTNTEHCEVELEVDSTRVGTGTPYSTVAPLISTLRKCIRTVLSGLQGSKYPTSPTEGTTCSYMFCQFFQVYFGSFTERYVRWSFFG